MSIVKNGSKNLNKECGIIFGDEKHWMVRKMKITNKEIMQLIFFATELRKDLFLAKSKGLLTETGDSLIDNISLVLEQIINRQSTKLIDIKE